LVSNVVEQFLALRIKTDQQLVSSDMQDIKAKGVRLKEQNEEIARKLTEAANKMAEAKATQTAMKVFGWIAAIFSVVAAVFTGGALAIVAAGVGVAMMALNESGVMEKLMNAIAEDRMKNLGESPSEAKRNAMIIMTVFTIAISVATIASSVASGTQAAANLGAKLAEAFPKIANALGKVGEVAGTMGTAVQETIAKLLKVSLETMMKVGTGAKIAGAVTTGTQAGLGVWSGVARHEAANKEAESLEMRAFIRRLQQQMEDEQEELSTLVQQMQSTIGKVIDMMTEHTDTSSRVIGQMRPQTA